MAPVDELAPLPFVGCDLHKMIFTNRIVCFFLTTRMFFIAKQSNKNDNIEKEKTKDKRKLAKLVYAPDHHADEIVHQNADKNKRKRKLKKVKDEGKETKKRKTTKTKKEIEKKYI